LEELREEWFTGHADVDENPMWRVSVASDRFVPQAEEVPKLLVVRADLVMCELVEQRVDERRVREEAAQVVRAQPDMDRGARVGVVPEQPLAAVLELLAQPVVDGIELRQ